MAAKRLEYAISVDRGGRLLAEDRAALETPEEWTPEHLVLAALARCSIASLLYHARRAGIEAAAGASAWGVVTKREEDGRYAFVEIDCRIDVELDVPESGPGELLAKAERDCFVGASLAIKPHYEWRVNGEAAAPSA